MKRFILVDDWRKAGTWISVKCMTLGIAIQGAWVFIPEDMKASLPPSLVQYMTMALLGAGVLGRLIKQDEVPK